MLYLCVMHNILKYTLFDWIFTIKLHSRIN